MDFCAKGGDTKRC